MFWLNRAGFQSIPNRALRALVILSRQASPQTLTVHYSYSIPSSFVWRARLNLFESDTRVTFLQAASVSKAVGPHSLRGATLSRQRRCVCWNYYSPFFALTTKSVSCLIPVQYKCRPRSIRVPYRLSFSPLFLRSIPKAEEDEVSFPSGTKQRPPSYD